MSKIEAEELAQVNELNGRFAEIISEAGQLGLRVYMLEEEIRETNGKLEEQKRMFKGMLNEEQALLKRLSDKYGAGSINFETGEFTPDK